MRQSGDPGSQFLGLTLWWWAANVYRPAQVLKSLNLYRGEQLGEPPTCARNPGRGAFFCKQVPDPVLWANEPEDPQAAFFDDVADEYNTIVAPFSEPIFEEARRWFRRYIGPAGRVFDPSAGPGHEAIVLARDVPQGEVVAADLSAGMVRSACANARAINTRARSPPDSAVAGRSARCATPAKPNHANGNNNGLTITPT